MTVELVGGPRDGDSIEIGPSVPHGFDIYVPFSHNHSLFAGNTPVATAHSGAGIGIYKVDKPTKTARWVGERG